jgi:hypothetical protein
MEKRSIVFSGSMRSSRSERGADGTGDALDVGVRAGTVPVGLL